MENRKEKAILLVHFGSTHLTTRKNTFEPMVRDTKDAFPEYEVREAYLSTFIIRILKKRGEFVPDNPSEALERLAGEGYREVIVQPTLFTNGIEFERLMIQIEAVKNRFDKISVGMSLLTSEKDQLEVLQILNTEYEIGSHSENAFVFMGHGSEHPISAIYAAMAYRMQHSGYSNAFIGAVEGYPDLDTVIVDVKNQGFKKVKLLPFMMVAGDHANNDMAGDEDSSWKNIFAKNDIVAEPVIKGMGELSGVRNIFLRHIRSAKEV